MLEHFLRKNPFAARIRPGGLVNYIRFETTAKGMHVPIDSAVFEGNIKRLVSLGRTNICVEVRTDLRYARGKRDVVERIVKVLEGIGLGFERLGDAGFGKVVFRVEEPDLDLTYLVGKPERVVRSALVSLHVDVVPDAC
jgi:acetylornithine deacetylase/succinyl-diaminopimelate desuccinylase-like protein